MFIKIMIVVVILACLGPFFIQGPDDEPLLTLGDLAVDAPEPPALMPAEPVTVYKWKDENGVWQFSTEKVEGEGVETMQVDGDVTVLDALSAADYRRLSGGDTSGGTGSFALPDGVMSVSPDKVKEMMSTVDTMQETMDERKDQVDRAAKGG